MRIASGIQLHGKHLRLIFYYKKVKCIEGTNYINCPDGVKAAKQLLYKIKEEIDIDKFSYAKYFPNSSRAKLFDVQPIQKTLNEYLLERVEVLQHSQYAENTKRDYIRYILNEIIPALGNLYPEELDLYNIKEWIKSCAKRKLDSGYVGNFLIPFRAMLDDMVEDNIIEENPLELLNMKRMIKLYFPKRKDEDDEVKPFNSKERALLLEHSSGQVRNFIQLVLYSGVRLGEGISIRWKEVDLKNRLVKINFTMVNGKTESIKTPGSVRKAQLLPQAVDALRKQFTITGQSEFAFTNKTSDKPWHDTTIFWKKWQILYETINEFLIAQGAKRLEYRNPYQLRHTYASMLVSRGVNIAKIAAQLGHKNTKMVIEIYGKYIPEDDKTADLTECDYEAEE